MNGAVRAGDLVGRPVVTLGGDDVAEVREVVFDQQAARVVGFTLRGRGFLGGRRRESLPAEAVHALGPDAVMVADEAALVEEAPFLQRTGAEEGSVLGARVLTEDGVELGQVTDLVLAQADGHVAVGAYQLRASDALGAHAGKVVYVPLPETVSISAEALIVPAGAAASVVDDPDAAVGAARGRT